jgi:RNA polymerase sigma-70 factor (ECF subfamily)
MQSFLLGVARNLVLKRWRDERQQDALEDEQFVYEPIYAQEDGRAEAVEKAILMLPPLQREAVVLAEYEEMSLEEIAHATQAELAAVKSRLHRGRQNLRRMLSPLLESKGVIHGTK